MDVRLVPIADAARELGRDVRGMRRKVGAMTTASLLSDAGQVVIVDGVLIETLADLVGLLDHVAQTAAESEAAAAIAADKVTVLEMQLGAAQARAKAAKAAMSEYMVSAGRATTAAGVFLAESVDD